MTISELTQIDSHFAWACTYYKLPGVVGTLVRGHETLWTKALGFANLEDQTPTTGDTL